MHAIARAVVAAAASAGLSCVSPSLVRAKVQITVDLDSQTIHVESKTRTFDWKISSGAAGYETPPGKYRVLWMDKNHRSEEYDGVPMPNAIFFAPGFAIHGTSRSPWGRPASHGCVRLPVAKSAILFALVKKEGADVTIIGPPVPKREVAPEVATSSGTVRSADAPSRSPRRAPRSGFDALFGSADREPAK